jgi:hypothetical protein
VPEAPEKLQQLNLSTQRLESVDQIARRTQTALQHFFPSGCY